MKNRKRGFSLVELLIVLAVIAALIATITPVAMNAIRKSQATKVAQNIKTLASAFENYVYVNDSVPSLSNIGRDIDETKYSVYYYTSTSGVYNVAVVTTEDAFTTTVSEMLRDVRDGVFAYTTGTYIPISGASDLAGNSKFYYTFTFDKY